MPPSSTRGDPRAPLARHPQPDVRVRRTRRGPAEVAPHAPPGLSVVLALGAPARLRWAGGGLRADLTLRRGDLLVVPAGLVHRVDLLDPVDALTVSASPGLAGALAPEIGDPAAFEPRLGVRDRHAEAALRAVLAEVDRPGGPSRLLTEAAASTALLRLLRPAVAEADAPNALPAVCVRRVADYVHAHLGRDLGVADLAAVAGLSPAHFSRLFAAATGEPPHRYVRSVRLDEAALLLRHTDRPVLDVALDVGYGDPSAFGAAFRRRFGRSPTAYRKAHGR